MSWTYQGKIIEELPQDCEAFVYIITNLITHQKYVGKKLAKFKTTKKPLKGRKNKRRGTKESDWKTYWGSSEQLHDDILKLGEHRFTRELPDVPHKVGATILLSTAAGLVTFFFMRFLTGTCEGMLDSKQIIPKLF